MGRVPHPPDLLKLTRRLEQRVRRLELRSGAHMETKTFIVGGTVEPGLFIPWVFIGVDVDERSPEQKQLVGLNAQARTGTVTVSWELDDYTFYEGHVIGTSPSPIDLRAEIPLDQLQLSPGWHRLRVYPTDGSATDVALAYATGTVRR